MTRKIILSAIPILAAILVGGTILPSFANDVVICDSNHIISNEEINADVVIPAGENCFIFDSTINGNISSDGAFLIIFFSDFNPVVVNGNIHIINAGSIESDSGVDGIIVSGNVKIEDTDNVSLIGFEIGKNLVVENNQDVDLVGFDVGKNAKCLNNGSVTGSGNTYGKNNNGCPV